MMGRTTWVVCSVLLASMPAWADDHADLNLVNKLRDEGINGSKVMDTLSVLTDEIGPRLTGSSGLKKASEWTRAKFNEWGLQNVHAESFAPFGRGWSYERASLRMLAPVSFDLIAVPKAWSPGTDGVQHAKAVYVKLETEEDFAKWKGKLAGKIVLRDAQHLPKPDQKAEAPRYSAKDLAAMEQIELNVPPGRFGNRAQFLKRWEFEKKVTAFLNQEKVLATLSGSHGEDGAFFVQGTTAYRADQPPGPPALVVMEENYNRLFRLLEKKKDVDLEIDVKARLLDEDPEAIVNVVAEIPGSDKKDEIVMLGGHLDSWHAGTGATDDGAGVAVSMEVVRLLKAINFKPRRTIRVVLWGGEEQGLLGSRAYVTKWLGGRPEPTDPKEKELPPFARTNVGPLTLKPLHGKVSAYFNLDDGGGKIRGVYAEGNAAVKPVFEAWFKPFHDLGATTVTLRKTGGTDHMSFDGVGIPAFQFIQDPLDYENRTHHTNLDVLDKVNKADLMQSAIVMASFVAHTANRDEMLPRKPLPKDPPKEDKGDDKSSDMPH